MITKHKPKYRNTRIKTPDGTFDSKKELLRWYELKAMQDKLLIQGLKRQVTYNIEINGMHICKYIADFVYMQNHVMICEDIKSPITRKLPVYRLKYKLMQAVHNITIKEV